MSLFDRMTESKEAAMEYRYVWNKILIEKQPRLKQMRGSNFFFFRKFCTSKKKEVWDALILHAKNAKNIEKVYDMTTVLQRVQQELLVVCRFEKKMYINKMISSLH